MKWRFFLILLFLSLLSGCGGGSSGTGTGVPAGSSFTIQGTVRDTADAPIASAVVTVLETGDSATTAQDGSFSIEVTTEEDELTLSVDTGTSEVFTTITALGEDEILSLTIKINPLISEVAVDELTVDARIVGACDLFFENRKIIRQANPVPPGTECTMKVTVSSKGLKLAHVPIAMEFRACRSSAPWSVSALGATMTGSNLGVAQVPFSFFDDRTHCVYRVHVPYQLNGPGPIFKELHTFTYQDR